MPQDVSDASSGKVRGIRQILRRFKNGQWRGHGRQSSEMTGVECQQLLNSMDLTDRDKPGIVNLFADDRGRGNDPFPGGMDFCGFRKQWKGRLERRGNLLGCRCSEP